MIDSTQPGPPTTGFLRISAAALLLGYLILGWIGSSAGISSLDANGIIGVVNDRLQTGAVEVSRPPGHPSSEYWMLPNLARIARMGGAGPILSPFAYGLYQLTGGVFCLGIFWLLLSEFPISPTRRLLATACLAFSPQFLITSSDGEEFLWGMACVFIAVLIIARLSVGAIRQPLLGWCFSIVFAVAASGYRIEYGAVALLAVFVTLLVSDQSWPRKWGLAGFALLLLIILWAPVLIHQGAVPPYPNPLSLKTRLAIGLYKIVFQAFGMAPLLIALVFVFQARDTFQILPSFRKNILNYWSLWLALIFFGLFFVYPTKILVVLPGVAFLILLGAVHAGRWTWLCFVLACLSLPLAHLDCFRNRHWTGLKFQPSLWTQNLAEKPSALGPEADAAARLASTGRHVIISSIWPWGLAWQKAHAAWPGVPEPKNKGQGSIVAYAIGPGIVASRSILDNDNPRLLMDYVREGYDIWIDQDLYREMYMRYDLSAPTPETAVIGGIPCKIVDVK
jgi:hypothetical protein